jgi:hypothetical protein
MIGTDRVSETLGDCFELTPLVAWEDFITIFFNDTEF